jgi:hypothetical protein
MPLVVISVLFGLSLLAAWVLFRVLQSTAAVKNKDYQLGGAAAGFVVILSLSSFTYIRVDNNTKQTQIDKLTSQLADETSEANKETAEAKKAKASLAAQSSQVTYSGTVTPPVQAAYVVLGVTEEMLQPNGTFEIKSNVKPADLPSIFVIGASSHAPYKQVFASDNPAKLTIPH